MTTETNLCDFFWGQPREEMLEDGTKTIVCDEPAWYNQKERKITAGYEPAVRMFYLKVSGTVLLTQLLTLDKEYKFVGMSGLMVKRRKMIEKVKL